jgi:hypothetical protein
VDELVVGVLHWDLLLSLVQVVVCGVNCWSSFFGRVGFEDHLSVNGVS